MTQNNMKDEKDLSSYQFDLDIQIETMIQTYEEDRERFWQQTNDHEIAIAKVAFSQAETIAEALLKSSDNLLPDGILPDSLSEIGVARSTFLENVATYRSKFLKVCEDHGLSPLPADILYHLEMVDRPLDRPLKLVWERLCIKLAWDGVGSIREGTLRILKLWGLLVDLQPSRSTLSFLQRVGRCFIWGFDPECIIVCRGAIDTAFRDAVSDDVCMSIYPDRKAGDRKFGLANRIVAAYEKKLIDKSTKKLAFGVKNHGDEAVHHDPYAIKDVTRTIKETIIVLKKLECGICP